MTAPKLETRGIRCLDCIGLDLKGRPDLAKIGTGTCQLVDPPVFVSVEMARNCLPFEPTLPDIVAKRDAWAAKLPPWFSRGR